MNYSPEIFVSYLFSNANMLEKEVGDIFILKFREVAEKEQYKFIADKINLMYGGKICNEINENPVEKFVVIILSDSYLCSDYCLYELHYLYKTRFPYYKLAVINLNNIMLTENLNFIDTDFYFGDSINYLEEKVKNAKNIYLKQIFEEKFGLYKDVQKYILNLSSFTKNLYLNSEEDFGHIIKELIQTINNEFVKEKDYLIKISKPNYINRCPYFIPKNLLGREIELEKLSLDLEENKIVFLESGIPGIGKTTLAKAFINDEKYYRKFNNIAWTTVSNNIFENFIEQISKSSHLSKYKTEQDISTNFKFLYKQLQQIEGNNLLIIDNTNNHDELQEFLFKIKNLNWKILLIGQVAPENYFTLKLKTISEESLLLLFYRHYKKEKNDRVLKFLLNLVNYNTLLIELMAKVANNNSNLNILKLYEIIKKAKSKPNFLVPIKQFKNNISDDLIINEIELYKYIAEIFKLENFTSEEIQFLRYFTVLPPYEMSEKLLINFFDIKESEISTFNSTLNKLLQKGWLHNNHDSYSIHVLIQPVLFKILNPNTENCTPLIDFFIKNIDIEKDTKTLLQKSYLPYAESVVYSLYDNSEKLIQLTENLSDFYLKLENFQLCLDYSMLSLQMKEVVYKDNFAYMADTYNNIANLYGTLNKPDKDLSFAIKALEYRNLVYEKNDLKIAESCNNIAITLRNKNEYRQAIDYHLKDIMICESKLDKNDNLLANSYYETAVTYYYLKNYNEAYFYINKALKIWKINLPENSVDLRNAIEIQEIIKHKTH